MRSTMCEWFDVKVRGLVGSGKRGVHEMEILGRNLKWTEELEYEASDKHRQSLLEGLGLGDESKTVKSASQAGGHRKRRGRGHRMRFRSLAPTLNFMNLDKSDVQYAAKDGEPDTS